MSAPPEENNRNDSWHTRDTARHFTSVFPSEKTTKEAANKSRCQGLFTGYSHTVPAKTVGDGSFTYRCNYCDARVKVVRHEGKQTFL